MEIYVVQENDNVDKIADGYGIRVEDLIYINQLAFPYALAVGQALLLPGQSQAAGNASQAAGNAPQAAGNTPQAKTPAQAAGYAYPFISPWVLEQTLPYISGLYIFSYGFSPDGELVEPEPDDTWMIQAARESRVTPVLTLTSIGPDGRFHSSLIHSLLNSPQLQQRLLWQLGMVMQEKGFGGIDLDFEYIPAEDRYLYPEFVELVRRVMSPFGYQVSVALAPKTSSDQEGLLYEGIDYRRLGEAADQVLLMTYEWGYAYGPPMAVAPIHLVRRVAEYALTQIPAGKIQLGIPNYGYDWPLPFVKDVTRARTLGSVEAVRLAVAHGAGIQFDRLAQSPYFHYVENGIRHEVWFEDARSYRAKFALVKELGLRGVGYWQLMQLFRAGLLQMADLFEISKESYGKFGEFIV